MEVLFCNKRKVADKSTIHQNSDVSKALLGKLENHWPQILILNPKNYCIPPRHMLLGQTTKQQLSNFEPYKSLKI